MGANRIQRRGTQHGHRGGEGVAVAAALLVGVLVTSCPAQGLLPQVGAFRLPTADGETMGMEPPRPGVLQVVCFLGTECPLARKYAPRLQEMADRYRSHGVHFLGVNSNPQDDLEKIQQYAEEYDIRFPIGKDSEQAVALQFDAKRTPEVFVVDDRGVIRYRGRIDDQYQPGIARAEPSQHDLRDALDALLAGRAVRTPRTEASGCLIARPRTPASNAAAAEVTYCNQVASILREHCVECHRPGEIGPFALTDYDEIVGWGEMLVEVVEDRRMPPWHANPDYGSFKNARSMPESDQEILRRWVEAGMPYGDVNDLPSEEAIASTEKAEDQAGDDAQRSDDAVLAMRDRPFEVPAEGIVEYQYFVVDPGFEEDRWVRSAEVIPGNPAVVHHAIVFIRPPDGSTFSGIGWLAAYVPGQRPSELPAGYARHVPAGSKLVFQMHYTPTGRPERDRTEIALQYTDAESVTHELVTLMGIDQDFVIPPHAGNHPVQGRVTRLPRGGQLLAAAPHMHLRGKAFRLESVQGSQRSVLLDVPHYDFNWQHNYEWTKPISLDEIDRLEFTAWFDNSSQNPTNPDAEQYVTWGDQTWEEMAVAFFTVARPLEEPSPEGTLGDRERPAAEEERAREQAERRRRAESFADEYLERFDQNGDGRIDRSETPRSFQRFGFWGYDRNGDGVLDREELIEGAMGR